MKNEVPTRWNSVLEMIEPSLDLKDLVANILKKIGKHELSLDEEDLERFEELRNFLVPFRALTCLVSVFAPILSCLSLMIARIQKI